MRKATPRGFYVVAEPGSLNPYSGSNQHIKVGVSELSKHFQVESNVFISHIQERSKKSLKKPTNQKKALSFSNRKLNSYFLKFRQNSITGGFRDLKHFLVLLPRAFCLSAKIFVGNIDFVYLRASFLDPLPIFLNFLNIPCFIEANGLQFEGRKEYYSSCLSPLNRLYERFVYSSASHVFFVGSYGEYWKLSSSNWNNVENGIEKEFIEKFQDHRKELNGRLHFAFVGRLMSHHRPQVLISAIQNLSPEIKSMICLHLIGSNLDSTYEELKDHVEIINHGFLSRDRLAEQLTQIHVGIIPGAPKYSSVMKLFDYGAAKCLAIVPGTYNLRYWFQTSELEFFTPEDPSSLGNSIKKVVLEPSKYLLKGENLYQNILKEHTWDKIFDHKSKIIQKFLDTTAKTDK